MRHAIRVHLRDFAVIIGLMAITIAMGAYILVNQRLTFPFVEEEPFVIWAEFPNAQAVTPGQGQTVRVAGMRVGDIGEVRLHEGRALVRLDLERKYDDLVHEDATALLRPRTGLKDMFVALDPGSPAAPTLDEEGVIPVVNTAPDVNADEVLAALDADSRAYLKLLITGVGKGLAGRSDDLREVFRRLGPLHRDLARLNGEVSKRRVNLARLVHNYGRTITRLAEEDDRLTEFVGSARTVFDRLAVEDAQISEAVSRLPGTLDAVREAFGELQTLGAIAGPAFDSLRPAVRALDDANEELEPFARAGEPVLREDVRPLVRAARPYIRDVRPAARNLSRASPDLRESFFEINRLVNLAAYNPGGAEALTGNQAQDLARDEGLLFWLGWTSHNSNLVFASGDAQGPIRRLSVLATCSTFGSLVETNPALAPILNVTDLLNDTTLCPAE